MELVPQHVIAWDWNTQFKVMKMERTDWRAIGKELNRAPKDCRSTYSSVLLSRREKGPFTAEEDALISQRVGEWGDKGNGLWVALEKEMDRPAGQVKQRWEEARRVISEEAHQST